MNLPEYLSKFVVKDWKPAYLQLSKQELSRRAKKARELLNDCTVCPRNCRVNRAAGKLGMCATGRYAYVASAFPHFGEEDVLRGWNGSGTIFFAFCNLKCVFCQNFDISRLGRDRLEMKPEELAHLMLKLQELGCHNINLVTPEHVVPQVIEALVIAIEEGLRLPIVYNTSAYDSIESIHLLEGIVDIYMPDFKFWDPNLAKKYLKAEDYPQVARQIILEMHKQVGPLKVNSAGLAVRGLLIRHLVMPGYVSDSFKIIDWIAQNLGPDTYLNIMDQYRPEGMVSENRYPEINREVHFDEVMAVKQYAIEKGLWRLDTRWRFTNTFSCAG